MKSKPRTYTDGDAKVIVSQHPHGRLKRAYGHWGYPYQYVAFFYKQGRGIFTTSFRRDMRVGDIKATLHDIAGVPMPKHYSSTRSYWETYCRLNKPE